MIPGARIQSAIELLISISLVNEPTDRIIASYFRKRRYAGSSDRRAIIDLTYNILRHTGRLNWWISNIDPQLKLSPHARMISELTQKKKKSPADIYSIFNGSKYCPRRLTDSESALAQALYGEFLNHTDMPYSVILEYPHWMDQQLKALWSERLSVEMSAFNKPAPVDLRVNTLKTTLNAARLLLLEDSVESMPTPMSPIGLRLTGRNRLNETTAFKMGLIEVQDEGSQLVALLSDAKPGMNVVDLCAGAGGKTLALAASMGVKTEVKGCLTACDISKNRLRRIESRILRAGAEEIHAQHINPKDDEWINNNLKSMDRVLADVPCTGTGTWRRNPVSRWQLNRDNLREKVAIQRRILVTASELVKLGGRLIYATCSIFKEENEQQLEWFIKYHNEFQALPIDSTWRQNIGGAPPSSPYLRISPGSNGTDGFFCALLEKIR